MGRVGQRMNELPASVTEGELTELQDAGRVMLTALRLLRNAIGTDAIGEAP